MRLEGYHSNLGLQFEQIVKGKNFFTPNLIGYTEIIGGIAEITKGEFMATELWGITIVKEGISRSDLSASFGSYKEVEEYITKLNYEDMSPLQNLLTEIL